ncbi:MAG: redoxin domain-containing protein [Armatimonadota bacterium]|nr:redoxin domain-containing protein [Armatimonadota bacterium]
MYGQYRKRGGVVLGLAPKEDEVASLKQFKSRHKVSYPIVIDRSGRLYSSIDVGFPGAMLVDRQGVIRWMGDVSTIQEFAGVQARFAKLLPQSGIAKKRTQKKRTGR